MRAKLNFSSLTFKPHTSKSGDSPYLIPRSPVRVLIYKQTRPSGLPVASTALPVATIRTRLSKVTTEPDLDGSRPTVRAGTSIDVERGGCEWIVTGSRRRRNRNNLVIIVSSQNSHLDGAIVPYFAKPFGVLEKVRE